LRSRFFQERSVEIDKEHHMENKVAAFLAAISLCASAVAQQQTAMQSVQDQGRTRAEVLAELACAKTVGEREALHTEVFIPAALDAARARAATTPACQGLGRVGGRNQQ
jgi:hypothetical protein